MGELDDFGEQYKYRNKVSINLAMGEVTIASDTEKIEKLVKIADEIVKKLSSNTTPYGWSVR